MTLTKGQIDIVDEVFSDKLKIAKDALDNKQLREALQNFVNYITIGDDYILDGFVEKAKKILNKK